MPLGWGRAVGTYVGSHFGSLGRPPGTKKGIQHIYNNEHGLSSSSQLQNQNNYEGRRSVATSSTGNFEYQHQHSSKKHNSKDEKFNNQNETTHVIDGSLETSYLRSLQIGAVLALCYNLFSSHFRLRVLQSQKPILNVNKSRRQLPTSELQQASLLNTKESLIKGIYFYFYAIILCSQCELI